MTNLLAAALLAFSLQAVVEPPAPPEVAPVEAREEWHRDRYARRGRHAR